MKRVTPSYLSVGKGKMYLSTIIVLVEFTADSYYYYSIIILLQ